MHPNGQPPAYEWALGDVNPPVHAWAAWRVYKIDRRIRGVADRQFPGKGVPQASHQLHWWVNRRTRPGTRVRGRLPGLDNIGVFDRSAPAADRRLHRAVRRHELDGHVLLNMLRWRSSWRGKIRPTRTSPAVFEHFVYIAYATTCGGRT